MAGFLWAILDRPQACFLLGESPDCRWVHTGNGLGATRCRAEPPLPIPMSKKSHSERILNKPGRRWLVTLATIALVMIALDVE